MRHSKPIHVFWSALSQRFYASRAYKEIKPGIWEVTGEKFDVTDDIAGLILKNDIVFTVKQESEMTQAEKEMYGCDG